MSGIAARVGGEANRVRISLFDILFGCDTECPAVTSSASNMSDIATLLDDCMGE